MPAIFRSSFRRLAGQMLGWGVALGLLGLYLMTFYDIVAQQKDSLVELLSGYPPELLALFGEFGEIEAMFTPEGFLGIELFEFLPLILGIFALLTGSGLLAADEEKGTLDLLLAYPISRTGLFAGRVLAFVAALAGILGLMWLGLVVGRLWSTIDLSPAVLARPFYSAGAVILLFGSLGLLLSLLLPSRRAAASISGLALAASFFVTSLARVNPDLEPLTRLSPLTYYQGGDALLGLDAGRLVGLLAVSISFLVVAWWLFERRDIRVAGEGGWRWPWRPRPASRPA